jgi:Bifunctional DNA primase/polymerase, N-terminal
VHNRSASRTGVSNIANARYDQQSLAPGTLSLAAAAFFTETLRVPVQPDWGILASNGSCQCRLGADCRHPGKHPSTTDPRGHGTRDLNVIAEWIRAGRNLSAAPRSYMVVDVEIKDIRDGMTPLVMWCGLVGLDVAWMMSTLVIRSGGGGLHFWFWLPRDAEVPKGLDGWLPDVDIKTEVKRSDKITLPGSRHASGRLYEFEMNALNGAGFNMPKRAPQVLLDEIAAGRAWELLPEDEWPRYGPSSSGAVRFGDVLDASVLWRRARILAPGESRPPASDFAGMALGSLTDMHNDFIEGIQGGNHE